MKKINLLNHQGLSFEQFKGWLNQLVVDKKGALPDFNDWKLIKQKLDKVTIPKSTVWVDYSNIADERYIPWFCEDDYDDPDQLYNELRHWANVDEMEMEDVEQINYLLDLQDAPASINIDELSYGDNSMKVQMRISYDQRKESEDSANSSCEGI